MASLYQSIGCCSLVILAGLSGLSALAQDNAGRPVPDATAPAVLTGKERLGRKWMDEQRIDNCNVPTEKRGTKPRPFTCGHAPGG